ncbi:lectin C-type domain protein, partial [Ostertagia ostertagi]
MAIAPILHHRMPLPLFMLRKRKVVENHTPLYNIDSTFFEAEDLCVAQGGHLASIHSQEENEPSFTVSAIFQLKKEFQKAQKRYRGLTTNEQPATKESDHTWIGLRRKLLLWNHLAENQKQSYGEWVWTDGTPVDYTEWAHDQPDNLDKGESCVQ